MYGPRARALELARVLDIDRDRGSSIEDVDEARVVVKGQYYATRVGAGFQQLLSQQETNR